MKKYLFLLIPFVLFGCPKQPDNAPSDAPKGALARVGGQYITEVDFQEAVSAVDPLYAKYAKTTFGKKNLLDILIRERLVAEDIADKKLAASADFHKQMDAIKAEQDRQYKEAEAAQLQKMWDEDLVKSGILKVSDGEIKDYFKKYPYEMTIRQVVLSNADDANVVLRELKANKARFAEMIKKYSANDPEAAKSITFMPGEYFSEIENVAANTPVGTVQGFIKTPHGFHIIIKDSEKRLTQKEAEGRIRKVLEGRKMDAYLQSLTEKYKVEVYEEHE